MQITLETNVLIRFVWGRRLQQELIHGGSVGEHGVHSMGCALASYTPGKNEEMIRPFEKAPSVDM